MGTSVVKFSQGDSSQTFWGVLNGENISPLNLELEHHNDLMDCYFNDRARFDAAIEAKEIPQKDVTFVSPISRSVQLFAQGLNYVDHRAESGLEVDAEKEENLLFAKAPSSICGPNDNILRPVDCELLDYEIELGIVLKKGIHKPTKVTDDNISDYIGGLFLCNDVSSRDGMFGAPMMQWYRGKSHRTFCPIGPVLYLLEEGDSKQLYNLELTLKMNGKVKQNATTQQLIHKPPKALTDLSQYSDINVGDCILTGTPGGVIGGHSLKTVLAILVNFKKDKKRKDKFRAAQKAIGTFLQPGDFLELEIKSKDGSINLGKQKNMIAQA